MKIPVWICTGCQFEGLHRACIQTYVGGDDAPTSCPRNIEWHSYSLKQIEDTELFKYFTKKEKYYSLTPSCSLKGGSFICPVKEESCATCSIRKKIEDSN